MKVAFLGSKAFGFAILKSLYAASERDSWRIIHPLDEGDARSTSEDFADFAQQHNLDFLIASSQVAADEMIRAYRPDVVLVCCWYWLIGPRILQIPNLGVFGIHNSLLPKYRGGSPLVWSILNGDTTVGATVFQFTAGMDDGPILEQVEIPIGQDDGIGDALEKIELRLLETLPAKWSALLRGDVAVRPQDGTGATYCGQRIPEDGHINWREPAPSIHNFVRSQTRPYPGAFCYAAERKISIWKTAVDHRIYDGAPGQILSRMQDHVVISCGQRTALGVFEVSLDGTPRPVRSVLYSVKLRLT
jgi:methionyl-tRNA formyltransferase